MTFQKRIIAGVTTVSLVLATATAPALANDKSDKMAKAIFGLAALALIVSQLDKSNDNKTPKPVTVTPKPPRVTVDPLLPRVCAVGVNGVKGERTAFGETCLLRNGVNFKLPRRCGHEVTLEGRPDRVFTEKCLAKAGIYAEGRGSAY